MFRQAIFIAVLIVQLDPVLIPVLDARRLGVRYDTTAVWFGYSTRHW